METFRGSGAERTESGLLRLKRPGRMRWEYRQPREKLFVTDGKEVWFYSPSERQARKMEFRKLEDLRSPLALLLGRTKLQKELRGLSLAPDVPPIATGNQVLRGIPAGSANNVTQVLLEVTQGGRIERLVMEGADGTTTEYRFTEPREDLPMADGLFRFTPPAGVEVISGEPGQ